MQGLYINEAGRYTIRFVLESWDGIGLAWVLSEPMQVRVGPPFSLGLVKYPGSATAGELLFPQPEVAVLDRGGNTVKAFNSGRIYAYAYKASANATVNLLRPVNGTSVTVLNGTGAFHALYIDEEGPAFKLVFTCSLVSHPVSQSLSQASWHRLKSTLLYTRPQPLKGANFVESLPFAVSCRRFRSSYRMLAQIYMDVRLCVAPGYHRDIRTDCPGSWGVHLPNQEWQTVPDAARNPGERVTLRFCFTRHSVSKHGCAFPDGRYKIRAGTLSRQTARAKCWLSWPTTRRLPN
jgi:hypothetical protein